MQRPLPTRQTQQTSLTGRQNVPDLDKTRQTQHALLKVNQQYEPHHANQLDKLDQPAKHLDN